MEGVWVTPGLMGGRVWVTPGLMGGRGLGDCCTAALTGLGVCWTRTALIGLEQREPVGSTL